MNDEWEARFTYGTWTPTPVEQVVARCKRERLSPNKHKIDRINVRLAFLSIEIDIARLDPDSDAHKRLSKLETERTNLLLARQRLDLDDHVKRDRSGVMKDARPPPRRFVRR